jgi:tRNA nucleotidyltransferase (CCA-adding enzyme)
MLKLEYTVGLGLNVPEDGLTIIIGHTNSDLDCFGSMILARLLYPGALLVRSTLVHPVARNLHHLYGNQMGMVQIDELDPAKIGRIVIVDTRTKSRIDEYFSNLEEFAGEIIVYDHHGSDDKSIPATEIYQYECGANTTLLGLEVRSRGIVPNEDEATIALTGIYADTGNFLHNTVTEDDYSVAGWLRAAGPRFVWCEISYGHFLTKPRLHSFTHCLTSSSITIFRDIL